MKQTFFTLLVLLLVISSSFNTLYAINPFSSDKRIITDTYSNTSCDSDGFVAFTSNSDDAQKILANQNSSAGHSRGVDVRTIDKVASNLARDVEKVTDSLSRVLGGISEIGKTIKGVRRDSTSKSESLKENIKKFGRSVGSLFSNIWKWIKSLWKEVFTTNSEKREKAKADRKEATKKIKEAFGKTKLAGKKASETVKTIMKSKTKTFTDKIKEKYQNIKDKLHGRSKGPGAKLADSVQDLLDTIKGERKPKTWSEKLKAKYQKVKNMITGKKTNVQKLGEAVDDLIRTLKGEPKPKTVTEKIKDAAKRAKNKFKSGIEKIKRKFD